MPINADDLLLPAPHCLIVPKMAMADGAPSPQVRRIVVATNDTLWAGALCRICDAAFPGCEIGVYRTSGAMLKSLKSTVADLVITSLEFPDEGGLAVVERLRAHCRLLFIVSPRKDDWTMMALRKARFDGFFDPQEDDPAVLEQVLPRIAAGAAYFSPSVMNRLLAPKLASVLAEKLTEMELKAFKVFADGHSNSEAAGILKISESTAKTHRRNIMYKLGVDSSAKLVREAVRLGALRHDPILHR